MLPPKKRKTYEPEYDAGATYVTVPKQVKSYVNRAIRKATELKYIDFAINGTASTSGTYQVRLNTIGVGTVQPTNRRFCQTSPGGGIFKSKRVIISISLALLLGLVAIVLTPQFHSVHSPVEQTPTSVPTF